MKGCFKLLLVVSSIMVFFTVLSLVWYSFLMTPEQRARAQAAAEAARAKEAQEKAFQAKVKRLHEAIIADEKPVFLQWLLSEGGCTRARFTADHELDVEMPRLLIPTTDDARVRAESIAERWAIRGGGSTVTITVYYGNEPYSKGTYSGGVHPIFLTKIEALGKIIEAREAAAKSAK